MPGNINMQQANSRTNTKYNRYPQLFGNMYYLRKMFIGSSAKILSFGCSTGEEMLSIRDYFSDDHIFGCDINLDAVEEAKRKTQKFDRMQVFNSTNENLEEHAPYNMIFANSVLCINNHNGSKLKNDFPFKQFELIINQLANLLTDNGILALFNTSYFPSQSESFSELVTPIRSHFITPGYVPKFDKDANLILKRIKLNGVGYYQPQGKTKLNFEDYFDVLYTKSNEISKFQLDYSNFDLCSENKHQIKLLNKIYAESSDLITQKILTHTNKLSPLSYKGGYHISKDDKDHIGKHFLHQAFCKVPGNSRGFVPLNNYADPSQLVAQQKS